MMILRTRKEQYLNEIVGNGNTAPRTPYTREELFFADILGEVNAPVPVTRIEIYLAKIANKYNGEMPEPKTRIEKFIARAAGMDVTIPTPITREEMLWANYALIVEKELNGIPPLAFNAIAGALKNYRIYGNTVNGESVGNKTANLLNIFRTRYQGDYIRNCDTSKYIYGGAASNAYILPQKLRSASINSDGTIEVNSAEGGYGLGFIISVKPDTTYTLNFNCDKVIAPESTYAGLNFFKNNYTLMSGYTGIKNLPYTFTTPSEAAYVYIVFRVAPDYGNATYSNIMLNEGDIALPYEPYVCKIPVTLTADSAETTDIYLDEPLAKSGDIADYIDYAAQRRYNADGTESSVTLPEIAVTAGANTLTVGTEVQPSNVYIKYEEAR